MSTLTIIVVLGIIFLINWIKNPSSKDTATNLLDKIEEHIQIISSKNIPKQRKIESLQALSHILKRESNIDDIDYIRPLA